jgi:hypothetical protein
MEYLKRFLRNARNNPKTTALGCAGVAGCVTAAAHDYGRLASAEWWAALFASAGLLLSADQAARQ